MEAGGIEPPSRDDATRASTRVVGLLNLAFRGPGRQGSRLASPVGSRRMRLGQRRYRPARFCRPFGSCGPDPRDGPRFYAAMANDVSADDLFARCFTRPPDNLGAPLQPCPPGRAQSPPRGRSKCLPIKSITRRQLLSIQGHANRADHSVPADGEKRNPLAWFAIESQDFFGKSRKNRKSL